MFPKSNKKIYSLASLRYLFYKSTAITKINIYIYIIGKIIIGYDINVKIIC